MHYFKHFVWQFFASFLALGVGCLATSSSFAVVKSWATGNGAWSTGGNWSPAGLPVAGDSILIGPHAAAENAQVTLNVNASVASLTLIDGMTLRTSSKSLDVNGTTQIGGQNVVGPTTFTSRLRVENGVPGTDYTTDNLSLTTFGQLALENDSSALVLGTATLGESTELRGEGTVYFGGAVSPSLINDGRIEATAGGLTLFQTGAGRFDLDGTSGNGRLIAEAHDGTGLVINGDQLTDPFSGEIRIGSNSLLEMNFTNGWIAAPVSSIIVTGNGNATPAILDGGPVELQGNISVTGTAARFRVAAASEVTSNLTATVANGNDLQFFNDTTITGGHFSTDGTGLVSFLGPSDWQGTVTINGNVRVNGMAVVSATTIINAGSIDLDGSSGVTIWDVNASLTVNVTHVDTASNGFDGAMDIGGAPGNQITVNLADPEDSWQMFGTLDLSGTSGLWMTRVAGSPMQVGGDINIANSNIDVTADVTLFSSSEVNFSAATSDLRLSGNSRIEAARRSRGRGYCTTTRPPTGWSSPTACRSARRDSSMAAG